MNGHIKTTLSMFLMLLPQVACSNLLELEPVPSSVSEPDPNNTPQCVQDQDCGADPSVCLRSLCQSGQCVQAPAPLGTVCGGEGTCQPQTCDGNGACTGEPDDALCDNGLFCDGAERCAPLSPEADPQGCIFGIAPTVDDGIECTVDDCQEDQGGVVHDASACPCQRDQDCEQFVCVLSVCQDYQCVTTVQPPDTPCDDGIACTTNDVCDDSQQCTGTPNNTLCPGPQELCAAPSTCSPSNTDADPNGCVAPQTITDCSDEDTPVFWLDAADGLSNVPERQRHNLQGTSPDLYGGDIPIARNEPATPREGTVYIYDIPFEGHYSRPPTVVLDSAQGDNEYQDRFEITAQNATTQGFELHVYRTDQPGEGFGKGPDQVSWSTQEAWVVASWDGRIQGSPSATQENPQRRPTLVFEQERPAVRFRDDWLDFPRPIQNDFSIVVVFKSTDERDANQWYNCPALVGGELNGGPADMGLVVCNGQVAWGAIDGDFDLMTDTETLYNDGRFHILVLTRQQDTGALTLFMDGQERASGTGVQDQLDANPFLRLARHPTTSGRLDVDYAELLFYNRVLNDAQRTQVEAYLRSKWGL